MSTEGSKLVGLGLLVLVSWVVVLSMLAFKAEPFEEVVAWVPPSRLAEMLSTSPVSVMDVGARGFVVLRGDSPGFVAALYASGAWMVLPARKSGGCVSRTFDAAAL